MFARTKRFLKSTFAAKKITALEVPVLEGNLLHQKKAVIMGGSGGIGSAIASAFARNGCRVVIVGTNETAMQRICQEIGKEKAGYIVCDIRKTIEISDVIHKAAAMLGEIDIFVHCAGVHCHDKFGQISEETWDRVMDVNLKSMYFSCQSVANYMIQNHIKGHILTIGSASSAKPGWTPYEISKNGVKALTVGFADKLIPYGIVVNGLAPGPVATPMLGKDACDDLAWEGNPTGRMSTPAEIANWAVFMTSDMGNMIVGDTFFVSGGSGTVCLDK